MMHNVHESSQLTGRDAVAALTLQVRPRGQVLEVGLAQAQPAQACTKGRVQHGGIPELPESRPQQGFMRTPVFKAAGRLRQGRHLPVCAASAGGSAPPNDSCPSSSTAHTAGAFRARGEGEEGVVARARQALAPVQSGNALLHQGAPAPGAMPAPTAPLPAPTCRSRGPSAASRLFSPQAQKLQRSACSASSWWQPAISRAAGVGAGSTGRGGGSPKGRRRRGPPARAAARPGWGSRPAGCGWRAARPRSRQRRTQRPEGPGCSLRSSPARRRSVVGWRSGHGWVGGRAGGPTRGGGAFLADSRGLVRHWHCGCSVSPGSSSTPLPRRPHPASTPPIPPIRSSTTHLQPNGARELKGAEVREGRGVGGGHAVRRVWRLCVEQQALSVKQREGTQLLL